MRPTLIITFSLLMLPLFLFSQVDFNFGLKIGMSVAQFPTNSEKVILETDLVRRNYYSTISPVIGMSSQFLWNHLELTGGIQYQNTNRKSNYSRDGRIPRNFDLPELLTYKTIIQKEEYFNKISFPFTIGYTFDIWNIKPSVYLGFNPNLFMNGRYTYSLSHESTDMTKNRMLEIDYNPVSKEEAFLPIKRISNQWLIGFSSTFNQRLKLDMSYSYGERLFHSQHQPFFWEPYYTYFANSDIALSFTYYLMKNND